MKKQYLSDHIFNMMGMGEHVNRLYLPYLIFDIKHRQIACLCRRITADIDNALRCGIQYHVYNILVHSGARRVDNHHIRMPVFLHKTVGKHIFHVTCIEKRVFNAIHLGIQLGILDSFRHVFDTHHLTGLAGNEIGNRSRTCI